MKNRENAVFKTRHLRIQKQMVIILKTFTYFISYYKCILNWITIKWIMCKRFKNNEYLFMVSQMPRFRLCIFSIFQLPIFLFLLSIYLFYLYICIYAFLHFCISAFSLLDSLLRFNMSERMSSSLMNPLLYWMHYLV